MHYNYYYPMPCMQREAELIVNNLVLTKSDPMATLDMMESGFYSNLSLDEMRMASGNVPLDSITIQSTNFGRGFIVD